MPSHIASGKLVLEQVQSSQGWDSDEKTPDRSLSSLTELDRFQLRRALAQLQGCEVNEGSDLRGREPTCGV